MRGFLFFALARRFGFSQFAASRHHLTTCTSSPDPDPVLAEGILLAWLRRRRWLRVRIFAQLDTLVIGTTARWVRYPFLGSSSTIFSHALDPDTPAVRPRAAATAPRARAAGPDTVLTQRYQHGADGHRERDPDSFADGGTFWDPGRRWRTPGAGQGARHLSTWVGIDAAGAEPCDRRTETGAAWCPHRGAGRPLTVPISIDTMSPKWPGGRGLGSHPRQRHRRSAARSRDGGASCGRPDAVCLDAMPARRKRCKTRPDSSTSWRRSRIPGGAGQDAESQEMARLICIDPHRFGTNRAQPDAATSSSTVAAGLPCWSAL